MKRNDAEQIGKLIQQFLRQESLESPLNEQRLLDAWPQILGPAAAYTSNLYIRNQTLYVHLTSAALRQELMMGREVSGAHAESESRSYRNYKYYFSLKKGYSVCNLSYLASGVFRLHGCNKKGFPRY